MTRRNKLLKKALENPKCSISMLKVKIVDLDKFIKGNFRWSDSEGKTNSNEPFKKGDVGYINIVNPEGWGVTNQMIETYEELFGVETFEGDTIDVDVILPLKPNI